MLDTRPEERFDRITRLASSSFKVPIAVISLVAATRQWFKSSIGLDVTETTREVSFCGHAILKPEVFVVLDAAEDPRFVGSPLVTGMPGIRFYAGAPLVTAKGFRFGTLCLIDRKPRRSFGKRERAMLADFAALVVEELYRGYAAEPDGQDQGKDPPPTAAGRSRSAAERKKFEQDQAHRAQLLFVASLSHELRTPLNAIKGFSEVLSQQIFGPLDNERYLEYAKHISDSATHLSGFVDSILDFVKTDRGEISLHEEWVDVAAVVGLCRTMFVEQMRTSGLELTCFASSDLPPFNGDTQLIVQMLVNLIGNSIKFTEPGGRIDVTAVRGDDGGLNLSVKDSGIGIAPGDIQCALVPFGQVENTMTRQHSGTGLGLSLTGQFVALHGGRLAIESEPGIGTTVELQFPAYRFG